MAVPDYSWRIDTTIEPAVLRRILDLYRPFRNDIVFSTGFCTREFGDVVAYSNPEPLSKLHYFESHLTLRPETRILDIGCNLGYYAHYFLQCGAASVLGLEFSARLFSAAALLRSIAGLAETRLKLLHGDFGDPLTQAAVARHGPYDVILYLGTVNNIRSLTAALLALPGLLQPGGVVVIEYLALDSPEPICRFHPDGFKGDDTHYWSFSEAFLDLFLASVGLEKVVRTVEWRNPDVLGEYKKVMTIYRRDAAA